MFALIDQLVQQGVRDFFLAPGSRSTPLAIAVSRHPQARLHRHFDERGLGFYALGCALAKEEPVAVITTSGTAVGNLVPAVMEAGYSSIPILLLTADRPSELREASSNQTADQVKMFQNFVRWQFDLDPTMPEKAIRSKAAQAVFRACMVHPGPVHLNCPLREPLYPPNESTNTPGHPIALEEPEYASPSPKNLPSRGILLIGRLPKQTDIGAVLALAEHLQWPIFADLLSSARLFPSQEQIRNFDRILDGKPECVLHFGERLTSKRLTEWLVRSPPAEYIHVSPHTHWNDPFHLITARIQCSIPAACRCFSCVPDPNWLPFWKAKEAACEKIVERALATSTFTESTAMRVLEKFPLQDWALFLANSMPIREADWFLHLRCKALFANRGLSGIDGNIATVAGISLGIEGPVLAFLGDLATLHDLNSIALLKTAPHPIILLVSNNDGCGIFSHLPMAIDPKFEELWGFSHGRSFEHAAHLFQIPYAYADDSKSLEQSLLDALQRNSSTIIEMKTSRTENAAFHQKLREACSKK